jgi:repressor LexA
MTDLMKKATQISARQKCMVEYIGVFWRSHGYPPSIRDIVAGCSLSSTSVADYNLKILEKRGLIKRHREVSRGIELPRSMYSGGHHSVPLIGVIAAGAPIPVPDNETWDMTAGAETVEVPENITQGRENVYALRVKGTSMIDALINDGDIVLMSYVNSVDNGDMAAVWLKDEKEVTLKKFYAEGARVRLQPANTSMKPIFAQASNVEIQGRVIGVIRRVG